MWDRRGDEGRETLKISGMLSTAVPRARMPRGGEVENAREGEKRGRKGHTLVLAMPFSTSEQSA